MKKNITNLVETFSLKVSLRDSVESVRVRALLESFDLTL